MRRFSKRLKQKLLRTREFAARNDAIRMARVFLEGAARVEPQVTALADSLTRGEAGATLEQQ